MGGQWVLIFVGCLYLWGAYKCMVKYESGNGDLAVAARRRSPLNFAWPWLERRSCMPSRESRNRLRSSHVPDSSHHPHRRWEESGTRVMGAYIHGVPIFVWVPIFT